MPYRYPAARSLDKQPKVGDFECVTLIRHYTNAPPANMWRQGAKVLGNKDLSPGTAIANFENGRWPGRSRGNHAAFYLGQVSDGIYIVDQWPSPEKAKISIRFIRKQRQNPDGAYANPSDNADAFWVIE
jgi:hypothetical protein